MAFIRMSTAMCVKFTLLAKSYKMNFFNIIVFSLKSSICFRNIHAPTVTKYINQNKC